jgi:hypothetical protein
MYRAAMYALSTIREHAQYRIDGMLRLIRQE